MKILIGYHEKISLKIKIKNNQNHRNQSTLLLESLFLKAVQDGLDPLDGHFASLSNDVLPTGLHRVQFQQLFCQKFLQVPVALVRLFPYKLIHILLEELNSGQKPAELEPGWDYRLMGLEWTTLGGKTLEVVHFWAGLGSGPPHPEGALL